MFDEVSWEAAVFGVVVAIPIIASVLFLASQLFMQANTSGNPGNPEVGPLTGRETLEKMKILAEAKYAATGDAWWKEKLQWIDKQLAEIRNA